MVKEGLEGALMEAVDTETAVCSLSKRIGLSNCDMKTIVLILFSRLTT